LNLYRFSSKELHATSGLVYYLYRFYEPSLQRWPNRDPLGEVGFGITAKRTILRNEWRANPYVFCRNTPSHDIDIDGCISMPVYVRNWIGLVVPGLGISVAATDWHIKNKRCMELADHPDEQMVGETGGARILTAVLVGTVVMHCPQGGRIYAHLV
jgi:RHS repeat-associated protein